MPQTTRPDANNGDSQTPHSQQPPSPQILDGHQPSRSKRWSIGFSQKGSNSPSQNMADNSTHPNAETVTTPLTATGTTHSTIHTATSTRPAPSILSIPTISPNDLTSFVDFTAPPPLPAEDSPVDNGPEHFTVANGFITLYSKVKSIVTTHKDSGGGRDESDAQDTGPTTDSRLESRLGSPLQKFVNTEPTETTERRKLNESALPSTLRTDNAVETVLDRGLSGDALSSAIDTQSVISTPSSAEMTSRFDTAGSIVSGFPIQSQNERAQIQASASIPRHGGFSSNRHQTSNHARTNSSEQAESHYSYSLPSNVLTTRGPARPMVKEVVDNPRATRKPRPHILRTGPFSTFESSINPLRTARDSIMALLGSGRDRQIFHHGNDSGSIASSTEARGTFSTMPKPILDKRFWIGDNEAQFCFKCGLPFNAFHRKHHCRTCGHIFDYVCMTTVSGEHLGLGLSHGRVSVCIPCEQIIIARAESDNDMIEEEDEDSIAVDAGNHGHHISHTSDDRFNLSQRGDELPSMNIPVSVSMRQGGVTARPVLEIDPTPHFGNHHTLGSSHTVTPIRPTSSRRARPISNLFHRERPTPFRARNGDTSDVIGREELMMPYTLDERLEHYIGSRNRADSVGAGIDGGSGLSVGGNADRRRSRLSFRASRPSQPFLKNLGIQSPRANSRPSSRLSTGRSGSVRQQPLDTSFRQSRRAPQELGGASVRHAQRLLRQLLADFGIGRQNDWVRTLLPMILHTVDHVDPNIQRRDSMDIRNYIKLKRVPGGKISDSRVVSGVVFTQNTAMKNMSRTIINPRIAMVTFPLEYAHTHEGVIALTPLISQEADHVHNLVSRILSLDINLLLAGQNVSGLAMKFLNEAGVVVIQHVSISVLHAVSRCTGGLMMDTIDMITSAGSPVGTCGRFDVKTYVTQQLDCTRKTLVILSGCSPELGATLILRGANRNVLAQIKKLTEFMCYVAYNLHLEQALLTDEGIADIDHIRSGFVRPNPEFPNPVDEKDAQHGPPAAGVDPNQQVEPDEDETNTFYADMVRKLRSRVLSSSPRVILSEPYALAKARAEERRLARVRALRDRYAEKAENGGEEEGENKNGSDVLDTTFELVSPSMVHDAVEKPSRPVQDFLHALHASEYDQALAAHESQKQQWLAYRHNDMFDPVQHSQIAVLYSCVSAATGIPCWGPQVIRFGFYNEDLDDEDERARMMDSKGLEENETRMPDVSLGPYLRELAVSAGSVCGSAYCDCARAGHRWQYVHGNGQMTIKIDRVGIDSGDGKVLMWSVCRDCKYRTPKRTMSEGTWKFSFAKFLELTFWGVELRLREDDNIVVIPPPEDETETETQKPAGRRGAVNNLDESGYIPKPPPDLENGAEEEELGPVCQHDVHRRHIRYVCLGGAILAIQYDEIGLWEIDLPSGIVRWKVDADLEMKNTQYKKTEAAIEGFVTSVKKRIGAMEYALRMMKPEEDRDKQGKDKKKAKAKEKEKEKEREREEAIEKEKEREREEAIEKEKKEAKEKEEVVEIGEVKEMGETKEMEEANEKGEANDTEESKEKDKIAKDDNEKIPDEVSELTEPVPEVTDSEKITRTISNEEEVKGISEKDPEKSDDTDHPEDTPPSTRDQCQIELESLRARIEVDAPTLRRTLQRIYVQSKHYEVIPFDHALLAVYKSYVEYQEMFTRIEQDYFPSEVVISQIANTLMQEVGVDPDGESEVDQQDRALTESKDEADEAGGSKVEGGCANSAVNPADAGDAVSHSGPDDGLDLKKFPPHGDGSRSSDTSEPPIPDNPDTLGEEQTSKSPETLETSTTPPSPPRSRIPRPPPKSGVHHIPSPSSPKIGSSRPPGPSTNPSRRLSGPHRNSSLPSLIPRSVFPRSTMSSAIERIHRQTLSSSVSKIPVIGYGMSASAGFGVGISGTGTSGSSQVQRLVVHFERQLRRAWEDEQRQKESQLAEKALMMTSRKKLVPRKSIEVGGPSGDKSTLGKPSQMSSFSARGMSKSVHKDQGKSGEWTSSPTELPEVQITESGEKNTGDALNVPVIDKAIPAVVQESGDVMDDVVANPTPILILPDVTINPPSTETSDGALVVHDDLNSKSKLEDEPSSYESHGSAEPEVIQPTQEVVVRTTLMKLLTSFWPKPPAPGWPLLENPLSSLEYQVPNMDFLLRQDEPTSVIALALASPEYAARLAATRAAGDPWVATLETNDEDRDKFTFNIPSTVKGVKASCRVIYAAPFDSLRRKAGVADRFVESMARCRKFDSKGGKTKSLFLKTLDDRFIVKSISQVEFAAFERFANAYFQFMRHTLYHGLSSALAKMLGVFQITIRTPGLGADFSEKVLVMENLFYDRSPNRRYDLKGSMRNRRVVSTGEWDEVLLDENFVERIFEQPVFAREHATRTFGASVGNDSLFLSRSNVMDYSLIAGFDDKNREISVGIIDCLRTYTIDKRFENWIKDKSSKNKPTIMSPKDYRQRFRAAMASYVLQAPAYWHHFYVNGAVLREDLAEGQDEWEDDEIREI